MNLKLNRKLENLFSFLAFYIVIFIEKLQSYLVKYFLYSLKIFNVFNYLFFKYSYIHWEIFNALNYLFFKYSYICWKIPDVIYKSNLTENKDKISVQDLNWKKSIT